MALTQMTTVFPKEKYKKHYCHLKITLSLLSTAQKQSEKYTENAKQQDSTQTTDSGSMASQSRGIYRVFPYVQHFTKHFGSQL
jgi:hypothetical protein